MKNILLLTTIYPLPTSRNLGTKVCHYFAQDWVRLGYNVRVIHFQAVFPGLYYLPLKFFHKQVLAKTGAVVYQSPDKTIQRYVMDDIPVTRIPLLKLIPHGKFIQSKIDKSIDSIISQLETEGYIPDIIVGHFHNPILEVVVKLKKKYVNVATAIITHGANYQMPLIYGNKLLDFVSQIDCWGFRSNVIKRDFEKHVTIVEKTFMCYSGVPEKYITSRNTHLYNGKIHNYLYVGSLIKRKHPVELLLALNEAHPGGDFEINYVGGDGDEEKKIRKYAKRLDIENKVQILGKIPRDKIIELYDKADCMMMISEGEAYGLVYLEAMARGCLTIASYNEGFDGVIKNGINGFLCNAGDWKMLANIIKSIQSMTSDEKQKISDNAIATAKWLTDKNAAKMYIEDVIRLSK